MGRATALLFAREGARLALAGRRAGLLQELGEQIAEETGTATLGLPCDVRNRDEVAAMLAGTPEIARTVITHRFPLDDAAEAFRVAADRASGAIKVVLEP